MPNVPANGCLNNWNAASGRLPTQKDPVDFVKEIRVPVPERMKKRRSSRERVAESGLSARPPEKFAVF
jgi:hypothetical protein